MGRYDYARSHSGASRDSRDAAGRKRKLSESSGGNSSKVNKTEKTRVEAKPDVRTEVKPKIDAKAKPSSSTCKPTSNDCKQLRAEVRSVFLAYKALQHACKAGKSKEEGDDSSEAEVLTVGPSEEKHFHTLLASLKAKPCVRRLAARVLPSLAVRYPQLLDSVIHACLSTSDSIPKDITEKHSKATKKEVRAEIISRQDAPSALAAAKYAFHSLRGKLKGNDAFAELVALFKSVPKPTLTALLSCASSADKLAVEVAEAFLGQLVLKQAALVREVLHPDAHLERWLVQQVRDARQQAVPGTPLHDALRRTQPAVDKVISALSTFTPEDLNVKFPSSPEPVDVSEPEPEPEPAKNEKEQIEPTSDVAEEELPSSTPPPPPSPQLPPLMEQQPAAYVQSNQPPPPPPGVPVVDPQWQQPPLPPMPHPHTLVPP